MPDHWTIADEIGVCPSCGAELPAIGAACTNKDCPTNQKEKK